jgi:hypothetical protein
MPDGNPLTGGTAPRGTGCGTAAMWASLAAVLSVAITGAVILLLHVRISADARAAAASVADRIEAAFNVRPEVRVDGVVVIESRGPVLEIATARTEVLVRHRWRHTHLYSTKHLEIEAPFTVKAGFDLRETPLRIGMDSQTGTTQTDLPAPQILSIEMGDPKILRDESGFWNKLTPADRQEAFTVLKTLAREQTTRAGLLDDARREAESRIREILEQPPGDPPG